MSFVFKENLDDEDTATVPLIPTVGRVMLDDSTTPIAAQRAMLDVELTQVDEAVKVTETPNNNAQRGSQRNSRKYIKRRILQAYCNFDRERKMHLLAANHFNFVNTWIMAKPPTFLTLIIGVLNLIASSDLVSKEQSDHIVLVSGILALVATFWKQLADGLDFGSRASLHTSAAITLKRLVETVNFHVLNPPENEAALKVILSGLEDKFNQALDGCSSTFPPVISASFMAIHDIVDVEMDAEFMFQDRHKSDFDMINVYLMANQSLFQAFCNRSEHSFVSTPGYMVDLGFETLKYSLGKPIPTLTQRMCPWFCKPKSDERDDLVYLLRKRRAQNAKDAAVGVGEGVEFALANGDNDLVSSLATNREITVLVPGATRDDVTIRVGSDLRIDVHVREGPRRRRVRQGYVVNYPVDPDDAAVRARLENGVLTIVPPGLSRSALAKEVAWVDALDVTPVDDEMAVV